MSIAMTQVVIPVVPVGTVDDSAFTVGTPDEWATLFAAQVIATRAVGTVCRARAYVSLDIATRMFGTANLPEIGPFNSPVLIQTFGAEFERITVLCDLELEDNNVRIE